MDRLYRLIALAPVLAALAGAAWYAVEAGAVENAVHVANNQMNAWSSAAPPTVEVVAKVRKGLEEGRLRSSTNPAIEELIGVIEARGQGPDSIRSARQSFSRALSTRPSSPYTWARLAEVMYFMGETGVQFESALVKASQYGPHEQEVQQIVAFYGLAVWDEASPRARAAVEGMVEAGMRRNPLEMLQIAERRGRLGIACRHFFPSLHRNATKSTQLCQGMEATP